jgi:hypothetical protein
MISSADRRPIILPGATSADSCCVGCALSGQFRTKPKLAQAMRDCCCWCRVGLLRTVVIGGQGVFEAADIREWRGHDVVDGGGHKIGQLEAVYVDTGTDLPSFGTVRVGMPTRHRLVFVPLDGATVGPGYLRVRCPKKQVKDAPAIDTDGELLAGDEEAIFKHYDLTYQPGSDGARLLARR